MAIGTPESRYYARQMTTQDAADEPAPLWIVREATLWLTGLKQVDLCGTVATHRLF